MSSNEHDPTLPGDTPRPSSADEGPVVGRAGRYVLREELGRGGMGVVFRAHDPMLRRDVALKRLQLGIEVDRFMEEARITADLEHPNIVPVYDFGVDQQRPWFTMRLLRGRTLADVLKESAERDAETPVLESDPDLQEIVEIVLKICDAMNYAHARGVLHRDLKPGNVMVGDHGAVWVLDWGIAARQPSRKANVGADVTLRANVIGTPHYMSPEQALGLDTDLDERTDIYALGVLLYCLLALRKPVPGVRRGEVLANVRMGFVLPFADRAAARQIPAPIEAVVRRALARERADRYATVRGLQRDLRRATRKALVGS